MQWPGLDGISPEEACRSHLSETTQLANYTTHMAGGLGNTLFDSRRRTCHSLILNYFVAGGGLKTLLNHFKHAVALLQAAAKLEQTPAGSKGGLHQPLCEPSVFIWRGAVEYRVALTPHSHMWAMPCALFSHSSIWKDYMLLD